MNVEPVALIVVQGERPAPVEPRQPDFVFFWSPCPRHITWGAGARRVAHRRAGNFTKVGKLLILVDKSLERMA